MSSASSQAQKPIRIGRGLVDTAPDHNRTGQRPLETDREGVEPWVSDGIGPVDDYGRKIEVSVDQLRRRAAVVLADDFPLRTGL
jgi:hypothetical protein